MGLVCHLNLVKYHTMKIAITILGLYVVFYGHACAQTNQSSPDLNSTAPKKVFDGSHVKTITGTVYDKIEVSKVEPDGVVVSYIPPGGGIAITKLYFKELPEEWQEHYKYDPEKAAAFKQAQIQGNADRYHELLIQDEKVKEFKIEQAKNDAEIERQEAEAKAKRDKEILDLEIRIRTLEAEERTALASERMAAAQENQSFNQSSASFESTRIANELAQLNLQLSLLK
jgi:hypothetical protein